MSGWRNNFVQFVRDRIRLYQVQWKCDLRRKQLIWRRVYIHEACLRCQKHALITMALISRDIERDSASVVRFRKTLDTDVWDATSAIKIELTKL